jgi:4-amino-4-deoxy-L-arabinose transferase-like glycosyltransferase
MIPTLLAYLLVSILIGAAYPWATWLLRSEVAADMNLRVPSSTVLQRLTLTVALSVGVLTLVMLWEGIVGFAFTVVGITLPYLLLMLPGVVLWWRRRHKSGGIVGARPSDDGTRAAPLQTENLTSDLSEDSTRSPQKWSLALRNFSILILLAISAAILFNAAYWPFHRDDALGIYQPHAQTMYQLRTLVPLTGADSLYRTYPMLIPSAYAFAYLASGWENEYLANLIGALLSVGCLPVAFWLGKLLKDERAGWLSALLLALTPAFGRWASAGYVDLPMAFFYGLSAVFAIRLWHSGNWKDSLLAGIMMGLAAWTKNAALLGVPLLGLWLLYALLRRRISVLACMISLAGCAVVAAPWYIRNWIGAGFIMPNTAWTDQAQRTFDNLLVFLTRFDNFGLSGWVVVVGAIAALIVVVRRKGNAPEQTALLLWALPMFAAWWLFVSYDPRFLLLFLPILCALGGTWLTDVWTRIPSDWRHVVRLVMAGLAIFLTLQTLWFSVEYKDEFLRNPLMGDADKRAIVGRE